MPEGNRPFVDRRVGFVYLFSGSAPDASDDLVKQRINQELRGTNLSVSVTKLSTKDSPAQMKLYLNDSAINTSNISTIDRAIMNAVNAEFGVTVDKSMVFAGAISPGGQVRNALPIPSSPFGDN